MKLYWKKWIRLEEELDKQGFQNDTKDFFDPIAKTAKEVGIYLKNPKPQLQQTRMSKMAFPGLVMP